MILGIDPGLHGGWAIHDGTRVVATGRMPVLGTSSSPKGFDAAGVVRVVQAIQGAVEAVSETPANVRIAGRLHARATARLAECAALWRGVVIGHGGTWSEIAAPTWQKAMLAGLGKGSTKELAARALVLRGRPDLAALDDGQRDAALIAWYAAGLRRVGG